MRFALLLTLVACNKNKVDLGAVKKAPGVSVEIVEAPGAASGDTGYWPNLLVDPNGDLHVAYCDGYKGDAKLAHQKDGKWTVETVEEKGAVGKYMVARWERDGPELIYLDQTRKTLRYAKKAADKWDFADIATDKEDIGLSGRFLVTPAGERVFIYYNTRNELLMTTGRGSPLQWSTEKLADAGAVFNLQADARVTSDGIQVAYPDWRVSHSALFVANSKAMGQAKKVFDDGIALKAAMVSDDLYFLSSRGGVLYQLSADGKRTELWNNVANFAALQLSNGRTAIAEQMGRADGLGEGALWVAYKDGDKWTHFAVDETRPVGQYISMAETKGVLNVAYYDGAKRALKLAKLP